MFDDDFSLFYGKIADLNGDGKVSMDEYLNEEYDYNHIMRKQSRNAGGH